MARSRTIEILITGKDRVSKVLKRITGSLRKWGKNATKIAGLAVAGLGAVTGALTVMFGKLAAAVDEQAKTAQKLNIANEELGVLRDAAGYAGVSVSTMEMALQRMTRRVSEAAMGTGEAKDAIAELGLNAEKLNLKTPDQALRDIMGALEGVENRSDRLRLAFKLFDSEGVSMVNMTRAGLDQAAKDAEELGLKLSSAQAKGVEAANDAWARIKIAASDFLKYVTATMAPGVEKAFNKAFAFVRGQDLEKWANSVGESVSKVGRAILGSIPRALLMTLRLVERVAQAFTGWKLLWAELQYQFAGFMKVVWTGLNKAREYTNAVHDRFAQMGLATPSGNEDGERIAREQKQILEQLTQQRRDALNIQNEEIQKQKKQNETFDSYEDKIKSLEQTLSNLVDASNADAEAFTQGEAKKQASINKTTNAVQKQIDKLRALRGVQSGSFQTVSFRGLESLDETLEEGEDK